MAKGDIKFIDKRYVIDPDRVKTVQDLTEILVALEINWTPEHMVKHPNLRKFAKKVE